MTRLSSLALVLTFMAAGVASPAAAQSNAAWSRVKAADQYSPGQLYDVVPPSAPNGFSSDPSRTGGGSIGYNQTLYNW
ncbi:MAG: hypothetical protein WBB34_06245 [Xanthobacteraceae bacterium]